MLVEDKTTLDELDVEVRLRKLSLEQKIGQMLMVGFAEARITPQLAEFLTGCHIGGVILFGQNVESPWQVSRLTGSLQELASRNGEPTMLIAADQEGGLVSRLKYPATVVPSAMAIAATGSEENAALCAGIIASEMRSLGFNANFAPVADINTNPRNPVIGTRAYGDTPELVSRMAVAAIRAHQQHGVLTMAKHFPGHGDTSVDSHLGLPVCDHTWERLYSVELRPFQAAIEAGVDMIVTSHVAFTKCDPRGLPATLSRALLSNSLRKTLGFEGVIVSDAMVMNAINHRYGMAAGSVAAARAGVDLILPLGRIPDQEKVYRALLKSARLGALSEERIDDAVRRILRAKLKVEKAGAAQSDSERWPKTEHRAVVARVMREAITLVKDEKGVIPLRLESGWRLGIVEFRPQRFIAVEERAQTSFLEFLLKQRHQNSEMIVTDCSSAWAERLVQETCEESDAIVLFTRNALLTEGQQRAVRRVLELPKPVVIVALQSPYDLLAFPEAPCYLAAYDDQQPSLEAVVGVLFGDFKPRGHLPVSLPGLRLTEKTSVTLA